MRHLRRPGQALPAAFALLILPLLASLVPIAAAQGASLTTLYKFCHGVDCFGRGAARRGPGDR